MYKKYILYIRRVPFFSYLLILCCKEVFAWEGIIFSKTELAEAGEAPQCYNFSTDFAVFAVVAKTTPSDYYGTLRRTKWDRSFINSLQSYQSKATTHRRL